MTATCAPFHFQGYLDRLDVHLARVWPAAARVAFLDKQIAAWEASYGRFITSEGATDPRADAADFLLVIAELSKRRTAIAQTLPVRGLCDMLAAAGGAR